MFAIFGAAIGVFIGGAKESIVSTILPSLITLVTGYIAYLATKEMDEEIKKNIPGAMIMFWTSPDLIDRFKGTIGSNRGGVYVESEVHRGVQG